jgi:ribonucleotide monophosphatase NagD (HAD superfamily)
MRDKKYKYALCDLSGTVHVGSSPIPGARAALSLLKSCNVNIRYLTNTSKTSRGRLLEQLRGIGFDEACIGEEEVITSVIAARNHLMDKNLKVRMSLLCLSLL